MLPDWQPFLREVYQGLAGPEGLAPVRGADDRNEGRLANRQRADSMGYHQAHELELTRDRLGDLLEHGSGGRVPLVRERTDLFAMVVVAHIAAE